LSQSYNQVVIASQQQVLFVVSSVTQLNI